jgi:hypothetical protein
MGEDPVSIGQFAFIATVVQLLQAADRSESDSFSTRLVDISVTDDTMIWKPGTVQSTTPG